MNAQLASADKDGKVQARGSGALRTHNPSLSPINKVHLAAGDVFDTITCQEKRRSNTSRPLLRESVRVDRVESRNLTGLASGFTFELFSPHMDDMDSSNNSSIVLKLVGLDPHNTKASSGVSLGTSGRLRPAQYSLSQL